MGTTERSRRGTEELLDGLVPARAGRGPLLQRDYWGVIRDCGMKPSEVIDLVARDFPRFAPEALVRFATRDGGRPLELGDDLDVHIRLAGYCRVRVVHRDANSFTLGTLVGHPEAGRITFGAYRNDDGDVVFHIRSRARSATPTQRAGFMLGGEPMQTTTWTDFVDRVAYAAGDGVKGVIHSETREIEDEPDRPEVLCSPTFVAQGE